MRRRRLVALAGLPVLVLLGGQGMAVGASDLRVTASARATGEDLAPTRTYGAPFLAVDPENPERIVAATPEFRSRTCRFLRSLDAGRTWKLMDAFPSPQSYPFCSHTSGTSTQTPISFGRDGAVYYAMNGWDNQDIGTGADQGIFANFSVLVAKSNDLGEGWDPVMVRDARGKTGGQAENNRPINGLAVDAKTGSQDTVYVGWVQGYPQATPAVVSQTVIATSTDGGRTFGEPVKVVGDYYKDVAKKPDPEKWGGSSPTLTVDDDGTVYAIFYSSATGQPAGSQNNAILLAKSTDKGKTFQVNEVAPPSGYYQAGAIMDWSSDGGSQGTLHIVYEDKVAPPGTDSALLLGDRDIFTRRSTDGGRTWSEPKLLNDDPFDPKDGGHTQNNPSVGIAPNGRVDAVWWDFRNDQGQFQNDVYYSYSEDNGATWSKNIRANDRSIDRRIGIWSNGFDMRTPVGIASTNELAVFAWDDTRNADQLTQGQDIYTSIAQHEALGSGSSDALRYALAGLVGLATVGLILLGVSMATGRRRPQAEPALQPEASRGRVGSS